MEGEVLVLLKLGGSFITDKTRPFTARTERLRALAQAVAAARQVAPDLRLVLGHGSGSFGHQVAQQYGTRQGVRDAAAWQGFVAVARAASQLHRLVLDALHEAGVPALSFPPSAAVMARAGRIVTWDLAPLQAALTAGLVPVVYGDVAFDAVRGGTIVSTEEVFAYLVPRLRPRRVLLVGEAPGVWADYPACTRLVACITPRTLPQVLPALQGSAATDVTGGMAAKVREALDWVKTVPSLEVLIFSGEPPTQVQAALLGQPVPGTRLCADPTLS